MPAKADEYIKQCEDKINTSTKRVHLPTIEEFARYIGINQDTAHEWAKKHKLFSEALQKIKEEQKKRLINHGLAGNYHASIVKLVLSNNHGMYTDNNKTDVTSKGEQITVYIPQR